MLRAQSPKRQQQTRAQEDATFQLETRLFIVARAYEAGSVPQSFAYGSLNPPDESIFATNFFGDRYRVFHSRRHCVAKVSCGDAQSPLQMGGLTFAIQHLTYFAIGGRRKTINAIKRSAINEMAYT